MDRTFNSVKCGSSVNNLTFKKIAFFTVCVFCMYVTVRIHCSFFVMESFSVYYEVQHLISK